MSARQPHPDHPQRGSAAIELPFLVGLVLIPFGLLVLLFPVWAERQVAARDGAAEAARVLAYGGSADQAHGVLREIERGYGLAPGTLAIGAVELSPPGGDLAVEVTVVMPGVELPVVGTVGDVTWSSRHLERAPDYGESAR